MGWKKWAAAINPIAYVTTVAPTQAAVNYATPAIPGVADAPAAPKADSITQADASASDALTNEIAKKKALAAQGTTLLTGPLGLENSAAIRKKTLLGS